MILRILAFLFVLAIPLCADPLTPDAIAKQILAPLLDPAKVATLKGDRPANPRLYKALYWLETAHRAGGDVSAVLDTAQASAGYGGSAAAKADKAASEGVLLIETKHALGSLDSQIKATVEHKEYGKALMIHWKDWNDEKNRSAMTVCYDPQTDKNVLDAVFRCTSMPTY